MLNKAVNSVRFSIGLWYQIIKPPRVFKGPFQLKNACPKPEIITGKVPYKKVRLAAFLSLGVFKKIWKP